MSEGIAYSACAVKLRARESMPISDVTMKKGAERRAESAEERFAISLFCESKRRDTEGGHRSSPSINVQKGEINSFAENGGSAKKAEGKGRQVPKDRRPVEKIG